MEWDRKHDPASSQVNPTIVSPLLFHAASWLSLPVGVGREGRGWGQRTPAGTPGPDGLLRNCPLTLSIIKTRDLLGTRPSNHQVLEKSQTFTAVRCDSDQSTTLWPQFPHLPQTRRPLTTTACGQRPSKPPAAGPREPSAHPTLQFQHHADPQHPQALPPQACCSLETSAGTLSSRGPSPPSQGHELPQSCILFPRVLGAHWAHLDPSQPQAPMSREGAMMWGRGCLPRPPRPASEGPNPACRKDRAAPATTRGGLPVPPPGRPGAQATGAVMGEAASSQQ